MYKRQEFGFTCHAYADDTQLYISVPAVSHVEAIERFVRCIDHVRECMARNRLKLNEDKTHIIWLGTRQQLNKNLPQALTLRNGTVLQFATTVSNLGVLLESQLTMADHIAAVCRSGFFQWFLPTATDQKYQTVIDAGCNEDTGARVYKQPPRLL